MLHFFGEIEAKVDVKARVFVPAVFRRLLQSASENVLYLQKDIHQNCLVLLPASVWDQKVAVLRSKLSPWVKKEQDLFRQYVLGVERLEIDTNGRILIPKKYLQMVGIDLDVIFTGVDEVIELWKKEDLDEVLVDPVVFSQNIEELMK